MNRRSARGFTLIEVMIVVAMVAILSAIALPAYNEYVTRGRIPDATANLATKQTQLEQWYQDNRRYTGAPACANDTTNRHFDFSCNGTEAAGTGQAYLLTATGKGTMAGFSFSIDQANQRRTASVPADWTLPAPNNCWVARKAGQC